MDVLRRQTPPPSSSALNPNAPVFIPMAYYDTVEDFSDQWWSLVQSSPWFRDYWLSECFQDPQSDPLFPDDDDLVLPDLDSVFDDYLRKRTDLVDLDSQLCCRLASLFSAFDTKERRRSEGELISASALKWNNSKARGRAEARRFMEKAPKVVNVKVSPRPIQQPR